MTIKHTGRIALVRHGQTYANIGNYWHGQTDTELTEEGYQQIQKLGRHFHRYMRPDVIYTSPLQRARLTAESIAKPFDLDVQHDPRLMEFNLGDWEGGYFDTIDAPRSTIEKLVTDANFIAPNGESQEMVRQRFVESLEEIVATHHDKNIVIVAHGISIGITLSHYLEGVTTAWPKYSKDNTGFSELCLNTKSLLTHNVTDHLK